MFRSILAAMAILIPSVALGQSSGLADYSRGGVDINGSWSYTAAGDTTTITTNTPSGTWVLVTDSSENSSVGFYSCPEADSPQSDCTGLGVVDGVASPSTSYLNHWSSHLMMVVRDAPSSSGTVSYTVRREGDLYGEEIDKMGKWPINKPFDSDGDGETDSVFVSGDYDGNGLVQTTDIDTAIHALEATDGRYVVVRQGRYLAPTSGLVEDSGAGGVTCSGSGCNELDCDGLISLPDYTAVTCEPTAYIEGMNWDTSTQDLSFSVFNNNKCGGDGNTEVSITNCRIHGGMPDSYDSTAPAANDGVGGAPLAGVSTDGGCVGCVENGNRAGIRIHKCTDCAFEYNEISHTLHSLLYRRENDRGRAIGNYLHDGSGYNDVAGSPRYTLAALYDFTATENDINDTLIQGNKIETSTTGITTRRQPGATGIIYRPIIKDNVIGPTTGFCLRLGGYQDMVVSNNTCSQTDEINTEDGATSESDVQAGNGLTLIGNTIQNSVGGGLSIRQYHTNVTMIGNVVDTTADSCMVIEEEAKNALVGGTFRNCGEYGIVFFAGTYPKILKNFAIDGYSLNESNRAGVQFPAGCVSSSVTDGYIGGGLFDEAATTASAQPWRNCTFANIDIDMSPKNFLGEATISPDTMPTCDASTEGFWIVLTDADNATDVSNGTAGPFRNIARCESSSWVDWAYSHKPWFQILPTGTPATDNHSSIFRNITMRNIQGTAAGGNLVAMNFGGAAWDYMLFENIHCEGNPATNPKMGEGALNKCIQQTTVTTTTIGTTNVTCNGNVGACEDWD